MSYVDAAATATARMPYASAGGRRDTAMSSSGCALVPPRFTFTSTMSVGNV